MVNKKTKSADYKSVDFISPLDVTKPLSSEMVQSLGEEVDGVDVHRANVSQNVADVLGTMEDFENSIYVGCRFEGRLFDYQITEIDGENLSLKFFTHGNKNVVGVSKKSVVWLFDSVKSGRFKRV